MTFPITRRRLLGITTAAASLALAAGASASPWAPRELSPEEIGILRSFAFRLRRKFVDRGLGDVEVFADHLRFRLGEDHLFRAGTAEPHAEGIAVLTELAGEMMRRPEVRIEIVGHHHSDGHSYRSFIISGRRATAVKGFLISRSVPRDRLLATGLGESFPIETNRTPEGRAQNRRVEFLVRPM